LLFFLQFCFCFVLQQIDPVAHVDIMCMIYGRVRGQNCKMLTRSGKELTASLKTKEQPMPQKTTAVQAVADSTQERRKSTRLRKHRILDLDSSDDSNHVSGSWIRKRAKRSKRRLQSDQVAPKDKGAILKMGRQIPLTFTARGKTLGGVGTVVAQLESSHTLPLHSALVAAEDYGNQDDNNMLLREWLERKANRGDLQGLQWYDKSRRLVKISWKHGSKSSWMTEDSQVFISWAQCTGTCQGFFISRLWLHCYCAVTFDSSC